MEHCAGIFATAASLLGRTTGGSATIRPAIGGALSHPGLLLSSLLLEVLEPGAGSRHPPAEFFASPGTLGRIGVDDGAVAEDPAVHHQA